MSGQEVCESPSARCYYEIKRKMRCCLKVRKNILSARDSIVVKVIIKERKSLETLIRLRERESLKTNNTEIHQVRQVPNKTNCSFTPSKECIDCGRKEHSSS